MYVVTWIGSNGVKYTTKPLADAKCSQVFRILKDAGYTVWVNRN